MRPPALSIADPQRSGPLRGAPEPGIKRFELDAQDLRLDPVIENPARTLFFTFAIDGTGKTPMDRAVFLHGSAPGSTVVLDFTRPIAALRLQRYALPLPPAQNRMPVAIEAGELSDVRIDLAVCAFLTPMFMP